MRRWEQRWARFWVNVAQCNHTTVWNVLRAISGRKNLECQCSEVVQRAHYEAIGTVKLNDHFDHARAAAATQWLQDFLAEGRGLNFAGATFTEREVEDAFKKLRQCACGIDGLSKKYIFPLLSSSILLTTALFSNFHVFFQKVLNVYRYFQ